MMEESENFFHNKYGYCYYSVPSDNKSALIYNLYVETEYRRKGHARELLQFVIAEIKKNGYEGKIDIEVYPREDSIGYKELASFYLSMGLNIKNKVIFRIERCILGAYHSTFKFIKG